MKGGTIRGILSLPITGTATATKGATSQALTMAASAFNTTAAVSQTFAWEAEPANNDPTSAVRILRPTAPYSLLESAIGRQLYTPVFKKITGPVLMKPPAVIGRCSLSNSA